MIIKDKVTKEEYLIPGCYAVANTFGAGFTDMTDREIIKTYCVCNRQKKEKYMTLTRDEVFSKIEALETKIRSQTQQLKEMNVELDGLKNEVFMLNTEEVDLNDEITKTIENG